MKPNAVLINVARSEIVEEQALIDALQQQRIHGAALDVFPQEPVDPRHPLLQMTNVLATPHIAGVTSGTSRRRTEAAVENVLRVCRGGEPKYLVVRQGEPQAHSLSIAR
jgi:phosphoglycerate dehydrogenase-like enzyme